MQRHHENHPVTSLVPNDYQPASPKATGPATPIITHNDVTIAPVTTQIPKTMSTEKMAPGPERWCENNQRQPTRKQRNAKRNRQQNINRRHGNNTKQMRPGKAATTPTNEMAPRSKRQCAENNVNRHGKLAITNGVAHEMINNDNRDPHWRQRCRHRRCNPGSKTEPLMIKS